MCENQEVDQELDQDMVQEDPAEELTKQLEDAKLESVRLSDEVVKFRNELETMKERFARTIAEYENFRKRTARKKKASTLLPAKIS